MASYNRTRYVEELLEKTDKSPPSFTIHLHPEYWVLNNGSKFLYHNQIANILDDIRAHRIPVDFLDLFDAARVPFYEGCMVVELLDYRAQRINQPQPEKPEKTRVILHPNSETLYADICALNQRNGGHWSDKDAVEVESKLLLATSPPLCLDPNPHLTRIANHVLRVSTPTVPISLKRKAAALEPEEDEAEKIRRAKIMTFMNPRHNRKHAPSYTLLDSTIKIKKEKVLEALNPPIALPNHPYLRIPPSQASPAPRTPISSVLPAPSPIEQSDKKGAKKKKDTPQMSFVNTAFTLANGSHTPIPPQPTHQFVPQQQHPPIPNPGTPLQPQVYANVQAATEAAKRTPTPMEQQLLSQSHQQLNQYNLLQQQHQKSQQQNPYSIQQQPNTSNLQAPQQQQPTQSPKPLAQGPQQQHNSAVQPHSSSTPTFQNQIPTHFFLQRPPPPGQRNGAAAAQHTQQQAQQAQQLQQPSAPRQSQLNSQQSIPQLPQTPSQIQYAQIYATQSRIKAQQMQNVGGRPGSAGGRATPQGGTMNNGNLSAGVNGNGGMAVATPSPVRGSPSVAHQQLAARASPMPTHIQRQGQQQQVQQGQVPQQDQQQMQGQHPQQQTQLQQQQPMTASQFTFTPSYNPAALRPMVHGDPAAQAQLLANAAQAHAAKTATSITVPGGVAASAAARNAQQTPSPRQLQRQQGTQQQKLQAAQQQQQQQQAQQQLRTPQMQHQQIQQQQQQGQQMQRQPTPQQQQHSPTPTPQQQQQHPQPTPQQQQLQLQQMQAAYQAYAYQVAQAQAQGRIPPHAYWLGVGRGIPPSGATPANVGMPPGAGAGGMNANGVQQMQMHGNHGHGQMSMPQVNTTALAAAHAQLTKQAQAAQQAQGR